MNKLRTLIAMTLILGMSTTSADETGTVLITGANRGIGLELARQYAADGWQVIGTARKPDAATELHALDVKVLQLDVTDQKSVQRMATSLANQSIDVLINNAGILPMVRSIADIEFDEFDNVMAVNTVGPMRVTQALLPNLRAGKIRKIINITSELGSIAGNSSGSFYGYRESKAALNMFTKSLAAELRPEGFTCMVLHPGWVQTDMGGRNAPLSVEVSASGIRNVIATTGANKSGTFWNYRGERMDW